MKCIFCTCYACLGSSAITPFFEACFPSREYTGTCRFNLAWMRHTGEWIESERNLIPEECLEKIRTDPWYQP